MAGLNKSEFDSLVGLLARAHYHGDTAMLEQHVTKAYDGLVKESGVPVSDLFATGPWCNDRWLQASFDCRLGFG